MMLILPLRQLAAAWRVHPNLVVHRHILEHDFE